ncbi:GTPase-activator protein for ras-like GTPase containing protein [Pleurostoma richardsiae]|uniref:GTPase-activator protein for ras-like GTPase containing protein n=1 Tax=Pleurostoma richardsiae TaxID=41990 RepID=A0AA38RF15_9PEZI|nr:GTPase-activator protein for ras-like GTPase containing protein [Pleurostoma richardsiae]
MASRHRSPEELLRAMEHHHEQYLKSLRSLQEALHQTTNASVASGSARMERGSSSDGLSGSPLIRASSPPSTGPVSRPTFASDSGSLHILPMPKRVRRLTNEAGMVDDAARASRVVSEDLYDDDEESDADEDGFPFMPLLPPQLSAPVPEDKASSAQGLLSSYSFTDHQLVEHLKSLDDDDVPEATAAALGDVWRKRSELTAETLFMTPDTASGDEGLYESATYEVYDVGRDGLPVAQHDNTGNADDVILDPSTVWDTVKAVNTDHKSVGRMTILQEPSPLMFGAVHLTMSKHFDMDELFQHLVTPGGNQGKTKAHMNRAFETTSTRQRSFFFVFRYYTVVGEGLTPAPWQQYDHRPTEKKAADHIDITECSSILALSLEGPPAKHVQFRSRRRRAVQEGAVYDTFAPWHLLSIQCFPDDEHSVRSEDSRKTFYNGPYAFLNSLTAEFRDAVKRHIKLNDLINKLITPPNQFMFDVKLRDKLLFEDKYFTYSRRYFWAYNTLGVVNDGIKSMISAYTDTFNADFWAGRHATLWPHPEPGSQEGRNYLLKMEGLRHELERAVRELRLVVARNEAVRQEIMSLREQLFSGSSVKESRRAIEQGDNIKILTSVSMIFLPLTFVTSVFGITEFTISASDWRFPVTMVAVCIPFFLLILILQTRAGMEAVKKVGVLVETYIGGWGDRAQHRRERRMQQLQQLHAHAVASEEAHSAAGGGSRKARFKKRRRLSRKGPSVEVVDGVAFERRSVGSEKQPWWPWRRKKASEDVRAEKHANV